MNAIEQMVAWLEKHDGFHVPGTPSGVMAIWREDTLKKARALEASQAEKDKGLVEELRNEYKFAKDFMGVQGKWLKLAWIEEILSRHQSNPIDTDYNKNKVAMNGHGIPVCPECGTKIEACGDCADYAEFKAWKENRGKYITPKRHEGKGCEGCKDSNTCKAAKNGGFSWSKNNPCYTPLAPKPEAKTEEE